MATAGPAQADAGAATSNGQVSPPVADSGIAPASDRNPFYGKAQVVAPPPFGEDVDAPEPDAAEGEAPPDTDVVDGQDDALDLEGDTQEGEAEADGEPEQPTPDVSQWATTLRDAPTRINEIPAKQRGPAIAQMVGNLRAESDQAAQLAYQQGLQDAQRQAVVAQEVAAIDELRRDDPETFVRWEDEHPDRAAAYRAIKAQQNPPPQTGAQATAAMASQQAVSIVNRLRQTPGAHEALLAMGKTYYATPESVAELVADAATAMAEASARQKANDPEARKAAQRQANAGNIKGIPKPAGSGVGSAPGSLTKAALLAMSQAEVSAYLERPGGEAEIDRVMASG